MSLLARRTTLSQRVVGQERSGVERERRRRCATVSPQRSFARRSRRVLDGRGAGVGRLRRHRASLVGRARTMHAHTVGWAENERCGLIDVFGLCSTLLDASANGSGVLLCVEQHQAGVHIRYSCVVCDQDSP